MEARQKKINWILKLVISLDAILIIFISIMRYLSDTDPFTLKDKIWTFYWIIFGLLILISEFQIKFILEYFNFLSKRFGQALFLFFIGSVMLSMPWYILLIAIFNFVLGIIILYFEHKFQDTKQLPQSSSSSSLDQQQKDINMNNKSTKPIREEEIIIDQ